jgi:hypothetical protein
MLAIIKLSRIVPTRRILKERFGYPKESNPKDEVRSNQIPILRHPVGGWHPVCWEGWGKRFITVRVRFWMDKTFCLYV